MEWFAPTSFGRPGVTGFADLKKGFFWAPQICKNMYHKIAISMGQQDNQWEFQDPNIGLKKVNGRYLQFLSVPVAWPLI